MRLVFLTQKDPFYLPRIYEYLLPKLKAEGHQVVASVLFEVAPFGRPASKLRQLLDTFKVFGFSFTVYYIRRYIKGVLYKNLREVMAEHGVKAITLSNRVNHPTSISVLKSLKPDLLISVAGNEIFEPQLSEAATFGVINLHSALLPKYRGLMPSFWVMRHGEDKTGVSVFFVDEGIDSGPIIVQKEVPLANQTQAELIWELKYLGATAIVEACSLVAHHGLSAATIENNCEDMTYFSRPTREDVQAFRAIGKKFF